MSLKLKLLLFAVVLGALGLSYRAISKVSLGLPGSRNLAANVVLPLDAPDADHDGIPDDEEAQHDTDPFKADSDEDGYLDGEEVLSGFSPTEKDTKKEQEEKKKKGNLTLTYLENIIGGALAGDLDPNNLETYTDNLNLTALGLLDRLPDKLTPPPTRRTLTVLDSDDAEEQEYLANAAKFVNFIPPLNLSFERMVANTKDTGGSQAIQMWKMLSTMFDTAGSRINALPVPQEFVAWHEEAITTLGRGSRLYDALGKLKEDPLLAMASLDTVPDFMERMMKLSDDLNALMIAKNHSLRVHPPIILNVPKKK
ncbi:MAG: hypothetical protein AAB483_01760 [Patescibacteria group bacterium]